MGNAREAAEHILSWLNLQGDEAAVFTFDTRLEEVTPFTAGLQRLPSELQVGHAVRRDLAARRGGAHGGKDGEHAKGCGARSSC